MDQNKNTKSIEFQPFYYDLRNKIINPHQIVRETKYFWRKWKPLLGPFLTILIMELRSRCYLNKKTSEDRNYCCPSYDELAGACGVGRATIDRYLRKSFIENHPYLKLFIKVEPQYVYDEILKKKIRTSNAFYLSMDDPLLPEDEQKLTQLKTEEIIKEGQGADHLNIKMMFRSKTPVDNLPPKHQNDVYIYEHQNDVASNNNVSTNNVNNVAQSAKNIFNDKDPLVEDMVTYLGDKKSLGFYRKIAKTCPAQLVYRALGETKEAALSKRIKTTKGAYFTDLIKRLAIEQRVNLKLKDK